MSKSTKRHQGPPRGLGRYGRPQYRQASKIIAKFGGETRAALLLGVSRCTIYKWAYSRPYGTNGLIPGPMVDRILEAAALAGIDLSPQDWAPEAIDYDDEMFG